MMIAVAIIIIVMATAAINASHDHDGHDEEFNEHCDEDRDRDCSNDDPHRDRHDGTPFCLSPCRGRTTAIIVIMAITMKIMRRCCSQAKQIVPAL